MQAEEMCDFVSHKITYEEISPILQAIYPNARGYSVKSTKQFCKKKKKGISPRIFQDHERTIFVYNFCSFFMRRLLCLSTPLISRIT